MTEPVEHVHISEREADGTWEDCTWCSGLEWFRIVYDARKPATHAEAEALRHASGEPPTGGSNLGNLADGIRVRYGVTIPARISNRTILSALKPGYAAVLQGSMSAFGPNHPLSKWDRNFDGSHAVLVFKDLDGRIYWCDPEAPTTADVPVVVTEAIITQFVNAFNGQAVVGKVRVWPAAPAGGSTMYPINSTPPVIMGSTAVVKAQSNIRVEPRIAANKVRTTAADEKVANVVGYVTGDRDPANGKTDWLSWTEGGQWRFTAIDNIKSVTPPAPAADCSKVEAELAVRSKQVNDLTAENTDLKTSLATVTASRDATYASIDALKK